jgi:hypothetical protein
MGVLVGEGVGVLVEAGAILTFTLPVALSVFVPGQKALKVNEELAVKLICFELPLAMVLVSNWLPLPFTFNPQQ